MNELNLSSVFASQYLAALAMLRQVVEKCPEDLWSAVEYRNKFWHVAYHALFCTHLYLQDSKAAFQPWTRHQSNSQYLGPLPSARDEPPPLLNPYSKADVLEYLEFCCAEVRAKLPEIEPGATSGFSWLAFNKAELQVYSIRHLQHHTGQLADRLRVVKDVGVGWVSAE